MARATLSSRLLTAVAVTVAVLATGTPAMAATSGRARVFVSGDAQHVEFVAGTGKANQVEIFRSGNTVTVDDRHRIRTGKGCTAVKGDVTKVRCAIRSTGQVTVDVRLGDRNDVFANKTALYADVRGGTGRDRLYGGTGTDSLNGDQGADKIYGGEGDDFLRGGALPGGDLLQGGIGDDTLLGSSGDDHLNGGDGDDLVFPGAGKDFTWAGDGDDTILDAEGNDTVDAGFGDDRVSGGPGADSLYGAEGDDRLHGGTGADRLFGDDGDDLLNGSVDRAGGSDYDTAADSLDGGAHTTGDTAEVRPNDTTANCEIVTAVP
ncbi:calcium-binding protein [Actinoplanes sp. G11-F43]|uniref:calcium-binding protein n=1 Tax=Actinoplanes sp. G11-F43 TaxID=3424130 RepID=UPI003D358CC9